MGRGGRGVEVTSTISGPVTVAGIGIELSSNAAVSMSREAVGDNAFSLRANPSPPLPCFMVLSQLSKDSVVVGREPDLVVSEPSRPVALMKADLSNVSTPGCLYIAVPWELTFGPVIRLDCLISKESVVESVGVVMGETCRLVTCVLAGLSCPGRGAGVMVAVAAMRGR